MTSNPTPNPRPISPVAGPLSARVLIPGSKSITNRALVCAALADGPSVLTGALDSDDTNAMRFGLQSLGIQIDRDTATGALTVWGCSGRLPKVATSIDANLSGTTSRFLLPLGALAPGEVTIDGGAPLRARPMAASLDALEQLGCRFESENKSLPVTFPASDLRHEDIEGAVSVRGDLSSQFLSGLLLSAPAWPDGLEITVDGALQSVPYVELTLAVMNEFGASIHVGEDQRFFAVSSVGYQHRAFHIEPDASTASYAFAAAALCGGTVTVEGLGSASQQGDIRFLEVLEQFGAAVECGPNSVTVTGTGRLLGGTFDMSDISDTAQTLAVLAPFAEAPTEITGIGFIRRKETDRIFAMVTELRRLGVDAVELEDGIRIEPARGPLAGRMTAGIVQTYDDHRMAMSFALCGLMVDGISIADPDCVSKTFPNFWQVFELMCTTSQQLPSIGKVIAIDGPAGSGKSTIARLVAARLGLEMLDTGAMYRAVTSAVLRSGDDISSPDAAAAAAERSVILIDPDRVLIDGIDVTTEIRGHEVSSAVSIVAAHPGVRTRLVGLQREWMTRHGGGVVEGRDIGTVVFPDAPLKIFLTASVEVRARRRSGEGMFDETVATANIAERDRIDSTRDHSPLMAAEDSVTIDTSEMTIDDVVDAIVAHATGRGLAGE